MQIISSGDVYKIICKALDMVDAEIMEHSEIVGYTLFKMLQYENKYSAHDLIDYTMIGILHDIGLYKTGSSEELLLSETKNVWRHSIYGYLFLRYLSPMREKAEITLYHHLDYNKHNLIPFPLMTVSEHLSFADKFDVYTRLRSPEMLDAASYFVHNRGITYSKNSQHVFLEAERAFHITDNLRDGSYKDELGELLGLRHFTEGYKRGFLEMLIYTIDFRSEYTVLHTIGTTTFAMELARLMKLDKNDVYQLYYGALLHDIGKMTIPVEILESPNKLSKEEMAVMQQHVNNTEQILKGIVNEDVLQIAIRHHEKLDGSGYPYGLTAEQLTLPQRIIAVADILSALYQKRSYKAAFDTKKIADILKKDAENKKLCPEVVACTLKNLEKITRNFDLMKNETMGIYLQIQEQYDLIYERFRIYEK